jgi:hypothetical protein
MTQRQAAEVGWALLMLRWGKFAQLQPGLASAGQELLCQFGVGLAFLATVSRDCSPRVHPIAPQLVAGGLYGLIIPSPKLADLRRDGRYSLHSYPCPQNEDAFYISGRAVFPDDAEQLQGVRSAYVSDPARKWDGPPPDFHRQQVVEFLIETCLLTRTAGHGDHFPKHTVWHTGQTSRTVS